MAGSARVLVLGGSGFVGRNVCAVLARRSINFSTASRATGVDLRHTDTVAALLDATRPAFIVNCAAHVGSLNYVSEQAADVISDNARMSLAMYEAIVRTDKNIRVINPVANCAYPATAETFVEDNWWGGQLHRSVFSYGLSRRFLWGLGECFGMQHGVRSVSLLVPNMYGPFDSTDPNKAHALNALIAKFVKAQEEKQEELLIWGTGVAIREWLYAEDFARIVAEIIENPALLGLDEPVNIGQNFGLSVRELVGIIQAKFNFTGALRFDPTKPDGAPRKVMDDRRFRRIFPKFEFTDLNVGIPQAIDYYRSRYPY